MLPAMDTCIHLDISVRLCDCAAINPVKKQHILFLQNWRESSHFFKDMFTPRNWYDACSIRADWYRPLVAGNTKHSDVFRMI